MRFAAGVRAARSVCRPSFNFLGPLTNPAQPVAQAIGCADTRMAAVMAEVFARRGQAALVFRGDDGLDELTDHDDVARCGGCGTVPSRSTCSIRPRLGHRAGDP